MLQHKIFRRTVLACLLLMLVVSGTNCCKAEETYYQWQIDQLAVNEPINGLQGNAARGEQIVSRKDKGNCLTCHHMPITKESFHGTIGPPLHGIASRRSEGQLRLHVVDQQQLNPQTIMPGFYKNPTQLNHVLDEYLGKTLLSAQEVEDVVAYLMTLE